MYNLVLLKSPVKAGQVVWPAIQAGKIANENSDTLVVLVSDIILLLHKAPGVAPD